MILTSVKKHSEFTYGVHAAILANHLKDNQVTLLSPDGVKEVLLQLEEGLMGARRSLIAQSLRVLRQAIGYALAYKIVPGLEGPEVRFLVYKRTKKVNVSDLQSVLSLGLGGHLETLDLSPHMIRDENGEPIDLSCFDLMESLDRNTAREVVEEVELFEDGSEESMTESVAGFNLGSGMKRLGFVMDSQADNETYVGNIHFGVIYAIEVPESVTHFKMTEPQNEAVGWATAKELSGHATSPFFSDEFEPWSKLILPHIEYIEAKLKAGHK